MPSASHGALISFLYPFGGTTNWTQSNSSTDLQTAGDGFYFTANMAGNAITNTVRAAFFGMSADVPAASIINGIQVDLITPTGLTGGASIVDQVVQLVKNPVSGSESAADRVGSNKASATAWPTAGGSVRSFGGPTDLWGTTWTASEVRSANFSVDISLKNTSSSSRIARIDQVLMTVYYTPVVQAAAAMTDSDDTISSVGQALVQTGSILIEQDDVAVSAAKLYGKGTSTMQEAGDSSVGSGKAVAAATSLMFEEDETIQATSLSPNTNAAISVVEAADVAVSVSKARALGTGMMLDDDDVSAANVMANVRAIATMLEASDTSQGGSSTTVTGWALMTEQPDLSPASAVSVVRMTGNKTENNDTISAVITVLTPAVVPDNRIIHFNGNLFDRSVQFVGNLASRTFAIKN
jgi:hypothetical protein